MQHILFLCSGNVNRSPLAAALCGRLLAGAGRAVEVSSAGMLGINGRQCSKHMIAVAESAGLDLSAHRSQGLREEMLHKADRIVVMQPEHEAALLHRDESLAPKIVRLWESKRRAVGEGRPTRSAPSGAAQRRAEGREEYGVGLEEIEDPAGCDLEEFERCRDELQLCLEGWLQDASPG